MRICLSSARNIMTYERPRSMPLFMGGSQLEFVAIAISGPLLRTFNENKFVLVVKDRCKKNLTRPVQTFKANLSHIISFFRDRGFVLYGTCHADACADHLVARHSTVGYSQSGRPFLPTMSPEIMSTSCKQLDRWKPLATR